MLAGLRQGNNLVDDDFGHRVIKITVEQERVADLVKCGPHRLNVLMLGVFRKWHPPVSHRLNRPAYARMACHLERHTVCQGGAHGRTYALVGWLRRGHHQSRHTRPDKQTYSEDERADSHPRQKLGCGSRRWHGQPQPRCVAAVEPYAAYAVPKPCLARFEVLETGKSLRFLDLNGHHMPAVNALKCPKLRMGAEPREDAGQHHLSRALGAASGL